jgi:hypothetical protein
VQRERAERRLGGRAAEVVDEEVDGAAGGVAIGGREVGPGRELDGCVGAEAKRA